MADSLLKTPPPTNVTSMHSSQSHKNSQQIKASAEVGPFENAKLTWGRIDWTVLVWMLLMHAGCLAAPFYFSLPALAVAVGLHWLTCSIGVCLGYHRYLSHASFRTSAPVRFVITLCGVLSGEGSPLTWAATHRVHHARSDKKGDPHSPRDGVVWSHILWIFVRRDADEVAELHRRYTPDLIKDPILNFFEKTYGLWLVAFAGLLYAVGGLPLLAWGGCIRITVAYHTTWLINSASHLWGYRTYKTTDDSRNLWWAGLLAYGEGWHNNHHAWPRVACYAHRWWELDITWQAIKVLRFLGLARDVNDRIPSHDVTTAEPSRCADQN
jgi:sn-2 palmitoyl-lipid 9-desaturase